MIWFDSVIRLVQALVWPVVVFVLVFYFRQPIRKWFERRPESLKLFGAEVKWKEKEQEVIDSVETELADRASVPKIADTPEPAETPEVVRLRLRTLAGTSPSQAMDSAISRVAVALWKLFPHDVVATQPMPPSLNEMANEALDKGLISAATHNAVTGVGVMYELAMSDRSRVDAEKALEFMALTDAVLYVLRQEQGQASDSSTE